MSRFNVVLRILWPGGVARVALEEARRIPATLIVYRESAQKMQYDLNGVRLLILRRSFERGKMTPFFELLTRLYAESRGPDATVDLDLILLAACRRMGTTLYHDQFAGVSGYLQKLVLGVDYAVFLHETAIDSKSILKKQIDLAVLQKAKLVLTNSKWNQYVLKSHGVNSEVVHNGCDPTKEINYEQRRIVLSVSMWDTGRFPWIYPKIAERVHAPFVLAGSWAKRDDMELFVKRFGKTMTVTGPLEEQQLHKLYDQSIAYVRFGFQERGPGMGGLEAMAHGVPVITNKGLGIKELITDGEDGFIVNDAEEASERINQLISDEVMRRRMMRAAWEKSKTITWNDHAIRLRQLLEERFS